MQTERIARICWKAALIAGATNKPFRIGTASFDDMDSLNGKIAYAAVYRGRILSAAEIA